MDLDNLTPTNRYKLLKVLGGKCRLCPIEEIKDLEVDHIYNDGAEERTKYGSTEKIYGWYLEHENEAFRRLQPLCKEHHNEKHHPIHLSFDRLDSNTTFEIKKSRLILEIIKQLEGDKKINVPEEHLIDKLLERGFTKDEGLEIIKKMLKEASIYESKAGCYNRV